MHHYHSPLGLRWVCITSTHSHIWLQTVSDGKRSLFLRSVVQSLWSHTDPEWFWFIKIQRMWHKDRWSDSPLLTVNVQVIKAICLFSVFVCLVANGHISHSPSSLAVYPLHLLCLQSSALHLIYPSLSFTQSWIIDSTSVGDKTFWEHQRWELFLVLFNRVNKPFKTLHAFMPASHTPLLSAVPIHSYFCNVNSSVGMRTADVKVEQTGSRSSNQNRHNHQGKKWATSSHIQAVSLCVSGND